MGENLEGGYLGVLHDRMEDRVDVGIQECIRYDISLHRYQCYYIGCRH